MPKICFMIDKETHSAAGAGMQGPPQYQARSKQVKRIGIIQCITELDDAALRYLILAMNSLQTSFQFEFVPFDKKEEFLMPLLTNDAIDRPAPKRMAEFYKKERQHFQQLAEAYKQSDEAPDSFQIISAASFRDNEGYSAVRDVMRNLFPQAACRRKRMACPRKD
jgi:hypothetical protein